MRPYSRARAAASWQLPIMLSGRMARRTTLICCAVVGKASTVYRWLRSLRRRAKAFDAAVVSGPGKDSNKTMRPGGAKRSLLQRQAVQ